MWSAKKAPHPRFNRLASLPALSKSDRNKIALVSARPRVEDKVNNNRLVGFCQLGERKKWEKFPSPRTGMGNQVRQMRVRPLVNGRSGTYNSDYVGPHSPGQAKCPT